MALHSIFAGPSDQLTAYNRFNDPGISDLWGNRPIAVESNDPKSLQAFRLCKSMPIMAFQTNSILCDTPDVMLTEALTELNVLADFSKSSKSSIMTPAAIEVSDIETL